MIIQNRVAPNDKSVCLVAFKPVNSNPWRMVIINFNEIMSNNYKYHLKITNYFNNQPIAYWVVFHAFLLLADFFQNKLFEKILTGIKLERQTVWTLIRPDDLSGLILVQTVCQGYQQTTLRRQRVKGTSPYRGSSQVAV